MSWVKQLVDLVGNNWQIVKEYPWIFLSFAIIIFSLSLGVNALINKIINRQSKKEINSLKEQIEEKEKECQELNNLLQKGSKSRLLMGLDIDEHSISTSAENLSNHMAKKYSQDEE